MYAGAMLVYEYVICCICKIRQNLLVILDEFSLWQEFYPLNQDVNVPPLE